jgi:sulfatase maturation enzyme AslB (radical SAM superfamily)
MPKLDIFGGDRGKKHIVMLTLTQDCNLRCRYCYEPHKSRDYYMSYDTAQQAIIEYMRTENEFDTVEFDFFGGEPLMAFSLIRDLVNWFHTKGWPKKHIFFISTNGTILSEEIKTWLVKNKGCVIVGLSLDGNKIAHDLNRSNSYDQVRANIPFFMEHWPNQPAKMTISAETIPYVADSIIELEGMNIPFSANIG